MNKVIHTEEVKLNPAEYKPNAQTLDLAKDLLSKVESGEVQHIMVVAVRADGCFLTTYSDDITIKDSIFGMSFLKQRIEDLLRAYD